ncbi:MAG: NAD-dependent deacylase [Acidobacteria bacterium]|nr:NAD-dependent deacylase [Acidobacteriota bacterium]
MTDNISRARTYLQPAKRVAILTGAGISAESGVPTFRGGGNTAVWRGLPAMTLSSSDLLEDNPKLVWEWFEYRRGLIAPLQPNPAHYALAAWEKHFPEFLLITQNVDGLHQKAGSTKLVELHGNIWRGRCAQTGDVFELPETPLPELPPRGPQGQVLRPDVVLFGEYLPPGAFEKAEQAAANCDVFLVVGTSAVVYPAAQLPMIALSYGAKVIEVNPEETELSSSVSLSLQGKAGEILPQLLDI